MIIGLRARTEGRCEKCDGKAPGMGCGGALQAGCPAGRNSGEQAHSYADEQIRRAENRDEAGEAIGQVNLTIAHEVNSDRG